MPNADEIYATSGTFMKAENFRDADPVKLTISRAEKVQFTDRTTGHVREKLAVYFKETDECLVLNKTRYLMVKENTGTAQTEQWPGTQITIRGGRTPFGNEIVDTIVVEPPQRKPTGKKPGITLKSATKSEPLAEDPDLDEPIPF